MAIRFDIDKYNKIRDSYLAYIRKGKVDTQLSPLYDTYKTYWANDTEVKKAEQEYKQKENAESEKRRKIAEQRIALKQEQQLQNDTRELPPLNGVLYLKISHNGRLLNIENTQDFIANTKTYSNIQHILYDFYCYEKVLCSDDYLLILLCIKKQCNKLVPTAKPQKQKVITQKRTSTQSSKQLFQITDTKHIGRIETIRNAAQSTRVAHRSVWTCSGGLPSLGKKH